MQELKQKNPQELQRLAMELRSQVREMRFTVASRQASTKVKNLREIKKDLARTLTLLASAKHPAALTSNV